MGEGESDVVQNIGFTERINGKSQEAKRRRRRRIENLENLALQIFTEKLKDNSMPMHGESSFFQQNEIVDQSQGGKEL